MKIIIFFACLLGSLIANSNSNNTVLASTVQPPTGGNYTLYKFEEYTYCLLTGFLILLSMGIIISLNEQNAMITENTLKLGKQDAILIANAEINSKNEGKLILVNDVLEIKWPIFEDELLFNISKGYKLLRKVEVLQHYELLEGTGSGEYYYYPLIWKSEEISSEPFHNKEYKNIKYEDWKIFEREFVARDASIGSFSINGSALLNLENYKEYNIDEIKFDIPKITKKFNDRFIVTRKDNFLLFSQKKDEERTGDFRITYFISHNELVSIIGQQTGHTIEPMDYFYQNAKMYYSHNLKKAAYLADLEGKPYTTDNKKYIITPNSLKKIKRKTAYKNLYSFFYKGSGITLNISPIQSIYMLTLGKYSVDSILSKIVEENPIKVWKIRFWGFIVNFLAFCVIATPFREMFEYVPYYGDIKNFAYTVFSASFSLIVTTIIVLISWSKFKPFKTAVIASLLFIVPITMGIVYVFYYKNK